MIRQFDIVKREFSMATTLAPIGSILFVAQSLLAQSTSATTSSPSSILGPISLITGIICFARRKHSIGGWLLYFLFQLFAGAVVTVLFLLVGLRNYLPSLWPSMGLYVMFLISILPSVLGILILALVAIVLLKTNDWRWVRFMRGVLVILLLFDLISLGVDSQYFPDNLPLSVLSLISHSVLVGYFFLSRRVESVFKTKDWEIGHYSGIKI
jgi:hypothetical protein